MTVAVRWGALLMTALPAACASSAPAVPSPPAAPAPAASSAAPPPPPEEPDASGFFYPFHALPAAPTDEKITPRESVFAYGRGRLLFRDFRDPDGRPPACPVRRAEGCASFEISALQEAPASWASPSRMPDQTEQGTPKVHLAPHSWIAFAGGRDAVYALREGGSTIDRIDPQGEVSTWVQDPQMAGWNRLWILDLGALQIVAGTQDRDALYDRIFTPWKMGRVRAGPADVPRRLEPLVELPMQPLPSTRTKAQDARVAARQGRPAAYGRPTVVPLPPQGDDREVWAMGWLEIVPPAYEWPAGVPQGKGRAPRPKKIVELGGCGVVSRSIDDVSVEKRAHITRFSGTRRIDDQVAWKASDLGPVAAFSLRTSVSDGKAVVNAPARPTNPSDEEGLSQPGTPVPLPRHESLLELRFDETAGEGLVAAQENERIVLRRFDADGRPRGDTLTLPPEELRDVVLAGGTWFALTRADNQLRVHDLSGQRPMRVLPPRLDRMRLVGTPQGPMVARFEGRELELWPALDEVEAPLALGTIDSDPEQGWWFTFTLAGTPAIGLARRVDDQPTELKWRALKPGEAWRRVELPPQERSVEELELHTVHGDLVIETPLNGKRTYTWVHRTQSASREVPPDLFETFWSPTMKDGPLLGESQALSPLGQVITSDALKGLEKDCRWSVPTGPRKAVVACLRSTQPATAELRVALRAVTLDAP